MTKKANFIRVLRFDQDDLPKVEIIPNNLESFQQIVGGLIEIVRFDDVICVINEEGKFNGSKPNFAFSMEFNGQTYQDIIFGDVFFVGDDGMEFRGLTRKELEKALEIASIGREELLDIVLSQALERGLL